MQQLILLPDAKDAEFSPCGKYRLMLSRKWDDAKPTIMFIGLNPSKADKKEDDPTIRRVIGFAKSWGFGSVYMLNLFAFITPYPKELLLCEDPLKDNDKWLETMGKIANKIVFAWGAFKQTKDRDKKVIAMFPDAYCLGKTQSGAPLHPLFVPGKTQLIKF